MITAKQAWIGLVILVLVALLVVVFAVYWHHFTGMSYLHVMASIWQPTGQGC